MKSVVVFSTSLICCTVSMLFVEAVITTLLITELIHLGMGKNGWFNSLVKAHTYREMRTSAKAFRVFGDEKRNE